MKLKRHYERPQMQVVELREMPLICTSGQTGANGTPTYNGFESEEEW